MARDDTSVVANYEPAYPRRADCLRRNYVMVYRVELWKDGRRRGNVQVNTPEDGVKMINTLMEENTWDRYLFYVMAFPKNHPRSPRRILHKWVGREKVL